MDKVSVVIPVYNSEKTLHKCIQSLLNQTHTNWECILVNDGSQDKSEEICREYEQKDSRFIVLSKPNGGVSSARNQGIQRATGAYITFVDSDDYISCDYMQILLDHMKNTGAAMAACCFAYEGQENAITGENRVLTAEQALMTMFGNKGVGGYIGGKVFRMDIMRQGSLLFDEEQHFAEDMIFVYRYLRLCSSDAPICSDTARMYWYVKHPGSALQARNYATVFEDKWLNILDSHDKLLAECTDSKLRRAIEHKKVMQSATLLRVMARCNAKKHPRYKALRRYVASHLPQYLLDNNYSLKKRVGAVALLVLPKL